MSEGADSRVARRYAAALLGAADRAGKTDAVQRDLDALCELWRTTPALREAMESPLIPAERKRSLVDVLFAQQVDPVTRSFLLLLVEKGREGILLPVEQAFHDLADAARGILRVQATVAAPLDEAQRAALARGLEQRTGKQIELSVSVDPTVLGGVVVRMHDTVIDGSVRGSFERLRERMLAEG